MEKGDDPYKILGVTKTATDAEIKKAYRKLAMEKHPDRQTDDKAREKAQHVFAKISGAYEIVGDEKQRKKYDKLQAEQKESGGRERGFDQRKVNIHFNSPYEVFKRDFERQMGFPYPGAEYDFNDQMLEGDKPSNNKKNKKNQKMLKNGAEKHSSNNNRNNSSNNNNSDISNMKISELRKELESHGVATDSFVEKSEFVEALQKARGNNNNNNQSRNNSNPTRSNTRPNNSRNNQMVRRNDSDSSDSSGSDDDSDSDSSAEEEAQQSPRRSFFNNPFKRNSKDETQIVPHKSKNDSKKSSSSKKDSRALVKKNKDGGRNDGSSGENRLVKSDGIPGDNRPISMETTEKKITHPDGTVETITETKMVRPDGSTETVRTSDKADKRPDWKQRADPPKHKQLTNGEQQQQEKQRMLTNGEQQRRSGSNKKSSSSKKNSSKPLAITNGKGYNSQAIVPSNRQ